MINARELRIGNIIFDSKNPQRECFVFRINSGHEFPITYSYTKAFEYTPKRAEGLEGILLTPEWLERFDKISWLSHDVGGYFFWFNGEKKYIKFLHNLQNVYFHIENIELCLDTKTQKYLISSSGVVINESTGKTLRPQSNGRGYMKVSLTHNGTQIQRYVHRLVAQLYLSNPNNLREVNHKDGNKANNHFSNLEWTSPLLNIRHAMKNGLFPKSTEYWNSKLSEEDINQIIDLDRNGVKGTVLAKMFGVSRSTISETINRKRHKKITGEELTLKS